MSEEQSHAWALPPIDAYATGVSKHRAINCKDGSTATVQDILIEELPVSLELTSHASGETHAIVLMATPLDVEALAIGFALTEGIIDHPSQLLSLNAVPAPCGLAVLMQVADEVWQRVQARTRNQVATSSCGLCGLADMQAALQAPKVARSHWRTTPTAISQAFKALPSLQVLGSQTGAAHAAAFVHANGEIVAMAEDAGRHNALDKLVGLLVQRGLDPRDGLCAVTSRASFEMVQKAARVGFPMLCAISAPTALAVRLANESGITLCGFVRDDRLSCFANAWRIHG